MSKYEDTTVKKNDDSHNNKDSMNNDIINDMMKESDLKVIEYNNGGF